MSNEQSSEEPGARKARAKKIIGEGKGSDARRENFAKKWRAEAQTTIAESRKERLRSDEAIAQARSVISDQIREKEAGILQLEALPEDSVFREDSEVLLAEYRQQLGVLREQLSQITASQDSGTRITEKRRAKMYDVVESALETEKRDREDFGEYLKCFRGLDKYGAFIAESYLEKGDIEKMILGQYASNRDALSPEIQKNVRTALLRRINEMVNVQLTNSSITDPGLRESMRARAIERLSQPAELEKITQKLVDEDGAGLVLTPSTEVMTKAVELALEKGSLNVNEARIVLATFNSGEFSVDSAQNDVRRALVNTVITGVAPEGKEFWTHSDGLQKRISQRFEDLVAEQHRARESFKFFEKSAVTPIDWEEQTRLALASEKERTISTRGEKLESVRKESESIQESLVPLKEKLKLVAIKIAGIEEFTPDEQLEEFKKISTELYNDKIKLAHFRAKIESQRGVYTEASRDQDFVALKDIQSKMRQQRLNLQDRLSGIRRASEVRLRIADSSFQKRGEELEKQIVKEVSELEKRVDTIEYYENPLSQLKRDAENATKEELKEKKSQVGEVIAAVDAEINNLHTIGQQVVWDTTKIFDKLEKHYRVALTKAQEVYDAAVLKEKQVFDERDALRNRTWVLSKEKKIQALDEKVRELQKDNRSKNELVGDLTLKHNSVTDNPRILSTRTSAVEQLRNSFI